MTDRKSWKRWMALAVSAAMMIPVSTVTAAEAGAVTEIVQTAGSMEAVPADTDLESVAAAGDFTINESGELTGYSGTAASVTIPSNVKEIEDYVFSGCKSIKSVSFPSGIEGIGKYAFSGCTGLTGVTIPDSVSYMGDYVFSGCTKLKSVVLPGGMLNVPGHGFDGCKALTNVTIPKGVEYVLNGAFSGCSGLKSVVLPDGMRSIGNNAFLNCSNLTSITIPKSVDSIIGDGAFDGCSKLTIYGYSGSLAESHAKKNNIKFVALDRMQTIQYTKTYNKVYGSKPFSLKAKLTTGNGKLSYTSSNRKVATVSSKGKVTIKSTGIAVITIKASGTTKYDAKSEKVTINVSPAKQKQPALSAQKGRKIKVTWVRDKKATGYQIQYSTDPKFKNKKVTTIKTVTKNSKVSITISKLKAGKQYYVRVRSYKSAKLNGKTQKLNGSWSSAKNVKAIK